MIITLNGNTYKVFKHSLSAIKWCFEDINNPKIRHGGFSSKQAAIDALNKFVTTGKAR